MFKTQNLTIGITFLSYLLIGLNHGILGVAWPSMVATFSVSLDAYGALITPAVIGATLVSFGYGWLVGRLGLARVLIFGILVNTVATVFFGIAPVWAVSLSAFFFMGAGSAALDTSLNTHVATNHNTRVMNWMHAFYGVGTTLGPLLAARVLLDLDSWRPAYLIVAALQVVLAVLFIATRNHWVDRDGAEADNEEKAKMPLAKTMRLPAAWLAFLLFFVYSGVEVSAGQWSFTLFTAGRGADTQTAALWVSLYWASFTGGRFLLGLLPERLHASQILRTSILLALAGMGLLWWSPQIWVGYLGLALAGLAMAPVFPTLMSDTPHRLGRAHAANAIGMQVAATGLGIGLLTSGVGWFAENMGLETIGALLFGATLVLLILFEVMGRLQQTSASA